MATEDGRIAPLTQRTIKALEPGTARYIVWDKELKGFGLRVEPSGAKTFLVRYRVGGGRTGTRRQFKVGAYGALTPDQARNKAEAVLANVALGLDPQADRTEARQALTVAQVCDLYLAEGCSTKKASTVGLDTIRIRGHIIPTVGKRKVTELDKGDVERMMAAVATGAVHPLIPKGFPTPHLIEAEQACAKAVAADVDMASLAKSFRDVALERRRRSDDWVGAWRDYAAKAIAKELKQPIVGASALRPGSRVRGGKTAATKSVKLLRAIYTFAIGRKLCAENPCDGVKTFADGRRERFLSPAELGTLGDALTLAQAEGAHPYHVTIVRLLCLTGARKNEIARLRWSEVKDGYLQLEESKTGRKVVPLGAAAQELLADVARTAAPWVFPDPRDPQQPIRNLDWAWVSFRRRAGLDDVRVHDLRHSFASVGMAGGSSLFLVGKLLGHAHAATTQRYAHLADDPVKATADRIASSIAAAMKGQLAEVTRMQGAGS